MPSAPNRHCFDGLPYYCAVCGVGIEEYHACDETECRIEAKEVAEARARRRRPITTAKPDTTATE